LVITVIYGPLTGDILNKLFPKLGIYGYVYNTILIIYGIKCIMMGRLFVKYRRCE